MSAEQELRSTLERVGAALDGLHDSFNVIDERSFLKVDLFVPSEGPLGEGQLVRRRKYALSETGPTVFVLGPEDTILQKVRWFELGGKVSDRQWRDILGVMRLGVELDLEYMREAAASGELSVSLERALEEGGRCPPAIP